MWYGEKIILSAIQRDYLPQYVEWLNDWEVAQNLMPGAPFPQNIEDETEWFEKHRKGADKFIFAILTRADKKLIGNSGLQNVDWKNRSAVFGIFIGDKNYWSKGYGTDATRTLVRFAFEQLGLNRIELWVYAFNTRAMRAYEKAGFKREGVRRQGLFRNGQFHDEILMSILRAEWNDTGSEKS
ncbi:MAG: GNAT family N-acetyltransferase [Chloroflexi bacterium]|nr:GNAT family N-acetyltransferase [Chloroflexota bacterium]